VPARLILGSGSPRRLELLSVLGIAPDAVSPPDIDEEPRNGELPRPYCARIAAEKVAAVPAGPDDVVLCADTTVAMGRRILGKPADEAEAEAFLSALSGRRHRVFTAVAVRRGARTWERVAEARVRMKRLSRDELARQGGRLFHPGAGRGLRSMDIGQLHGRRRPAAGRDGDASLGGGLAGLG
jgi:septum formation protein